MSKQDPIRGRVAVITGASSGIGLSVATQLAAAGAKLVLGARRGSLMAEIGDRLGRAGAEVWAQPLDVGSEESCQEFHDNAVERFGQIDILVNNAGLARGLGPVVDNSEQDWREMMETNVMGLMRMTRLFLPELQKREYSDLVQISSLAGVQPYANGAAYCASKAAVEAFSQALRQELPGTGVREFVIEPGMVDTEFSEVRFHGDKLRAKQVYEGVTPLSADDVADCIVFAISRRPHINMQRLLLMPTAQATSTLVHRRAED